MLHLFACRIPYADYNPYIRGSRWVLEDGVVYRVATYSGSHLALYIFNIIL